MKQTIITLSLFGLLVCSCNRDSHFDNYPMYVSKSDDDNWTTSAVIACDSCTMVNMNECDIFIDGRKMKMYGQIIKIHTNSNYHKK